MNIDGIILDLLQHINSKAVFRINSSKSYTLLRSKIICLAVTYGSNFQY